MHDSCAYLQLTQDGDKAINKRSYVVCELRSFDESRAGDYPWSDFGRPSTRRREVGKPGGVKHLKRNQKEPLALG